MRKSLSTIIEKGVTDDNEGIVTTISITEDEEELLHLSFLKTTSAVKSVSENKPKEKREVELQGLRPEQLVTILDLLDDWLESGSKPQMDRRIEGIKGEFTESVPKHGMGREESSRTENFEDVDILIDKRNIHLRFWDPHQTDFTTVDIPTTEEYLSGNPVDYDHVLTLDKLIHDFFKYSFDGNPESVGVTTESPTELGPIDKIENIFDGFGEFSHQLSNRGRGKNPLLVEDEYDIQYLLHALLKLHFDDVRDETYLKRHSTVSPRIDFLIEDHEIGIEVKLASERNDAEELRNQLFEDKEHYRSDPNCKTLLCFIYDPERILTNPVEIEKDISGSLDNLVTRVTITHF